MKKDCEKTTHYTKNRPAVQGHSGAIDRGWLVEWLKYR